MAYTPEKPNWTPITNSEAFALTGCTDSPGTYYSYPVSALPSQLQKMPGLYEAYASGYCYTYKDEKEVAVLGEAIAARKDEVGKGYVYFIGLSGTQPCFAGPYKPQDGHHYDPSVGVPVEKLFGHSPPPVEQ
jgi:hypothetical protein